MALSGTFVFRYFCGAKEELFLNIHDLSLKTRLSLHARLSQQSSSSWIELSKKEGKKKGEHGNLRGPTDTPRSPQRAIATFSVVNFPKARVGRKSIRHCLWLAVDEVLFVFGPCSRTRGNRGA